MECEATSPQKYRTITLDIEILHEQDESIILNELSKTMGKLETLGVEITDWKFDESLVYGKVEE